MVLELLRESLLENAFVRAILLAEELNASLAAYFRWTRTKPIEQSQALASCSMVACPPNAIVVLQGQPYINPTHFGTRSAPARR